MRKAKKVFSLMLAVLLVLSLGISAFAAEKTAADSGEAVRIIDFSERKGEMAPLLESKSGELWQFDFVTNFDGQDEFFLLNTDWESGWRYTIALSFDFDVTYEELSAEITGDLIWEAGAREYDTSVEPWVPVDGESVIIVEISIDANRTAKYKEGSITFFVGDREGCTFTFVNDVPIIDPDKVISAAMNDEEVQVTRSGISSYYYETQGKKVEGGYAYAISEDAFAAIEGMDLTVVDYLNHSVYIHEVAEGQQGINFYGFNYLHSHNDLEEEIETPSMRIRFFDETPILGRYDIIWDTYYNLDELKTALNQEGKNTVKYSVFKNYTDLKKQYVIDYTNADIYQSLVLRIECENEALGSYMFTASENTVDYGTFYNYEGYKTINWKFGTDGKLTISGTGIAEDTSYYLSGVDVVPGVTAAPWHDYANDVAEIVIEDGIEGFSENAFRGLENAKKITIPKSVHYMGYYYSFMTYLNVETAGPIGGGYDCEFGWTESIPRDAFYDCDTLREAVIPEGITEIGEYAFLDCDSLEKVVFEGDAPNVFAAGSEYDTFSKDVVTLYYYEGCSGWTSPEWNGYKTVMIETGSDPEPEKPKVAITSASVKAGSTATVSVTVPENFGAEMIQFAIKYDVSKLEVVSVSEGVAKEAEINTDYPGYIYFAWDSIEPLTEGGALFDIEFAVAEGASGGETAVEFDLNEEFVFKNGNYEDISFEITNGVVTVSSIYYGDVNGDGKINVLDANLIRRYAARLIDFDDTQFMAADVSGDGKVNVIDANLVRRYAAKLIDRFPVEY